MIGRWFKQLLRYIVVGALSLVPLVLVLIVVNFLKELGISAYFSLHHYTNSFGVTMALMVAVMLLFAVFGYSLEKYGRFFILSLIDRIFASIPAIRTVYSVAKKVSDMLSGRSDNGKKEVVLVEYPKEDVWVPSYVLSRYDRVCVLFVPTSPNPTSGYTVIVKESLIIPTSLTLEEASSFIISMGADFVKKEEIAALINGTHAR
jgi:uncharacterized membrane protein